MSVYRGQKQGLEQDPVQPEYMLDSSRLPYAMARYLLCIYMYTHHTTVHTGYSVWSRRVHMSCSRSNLLVGRPIPPPYVYTYMLYT